jgi:hypothetical protein
MFATIWRFQRHPVFNRSRSSFSFSFARSGENENEHEPDLGPCRVGVKQLTADLLRRNYNQ